MTLSNRVGVTDRMQDPWVDPEEAKIALHLRLRCEDDVGLAGGGWRGLEGVEGGRVERVENRP